MSAHPSIVLYTPEPASGASRYVCELARALAARGVPLILLAPKNFEQGAVLRQEEHLRWEALGLRSNGVERGLARRLWDNVRFLVQATFVQCCWVRSKHILHIQFPLHLPFGLIPFVAAKMAGCRIVLTAHDPIPHKWLLPASWRRLERLSLAWMYRLSDRIIVHNNAGRETIEREFGMSAAKLDVIAHGTLALQEPIRCTNASDTLQVLVFGSLRENKGIHLAIRAVQNLACGGLPLRLTIAGDTPNGKEEAYWGTCEALLSQGSDFIEIRKRYVPDSELARLLADCDCALLPYTDFTSESGVASLALSNGVPIIATSHGGLGELLRATGAGFHIENATVAGVESALLKAHQVGKEELQRLGRSGADYFARHRSWSAIAKQTSDLYCQLANDKQPS